MHEPCFHSYAPQRRRAQLVHRILRPGLENPVTGPHIVQEEVAKRMNNLVPQGIGDRKHPAIHNRSSGKRCHRFNMADVTANIFEELLTGLRTRCCSEGEIPRRYFGTPDKRCEVIDRVHSDRVGRIFGVGFDLANACGIDRLQAIGHAHLVQIGVTDEGEQAAVLIFPAEAADSRLAWSFQDGNLDGLSLNYAAAGVRLVGGNIQQRLIVHRLDETVSQGVEDSPERANVLGIRHVLLRLRTGGAIVDEGPAGDSARAIIDQNGRIRKISIRILVAYPDLRNLARATSDRVLMAFGASRRVEHRT